MLRWLRLPPPGFDELVDEATKQSSAVNEARRLTTSEARSFLWKTITAEKVEGDPPKIQGGLYKTVETHLICVFFFKKLRQ